jgi:hypothetical protein
MSTKDRYDLTIILYPYTRKDYPQSIVNGVPTRVSTYLAGNSFALLIQREGASIVVKVI